MAAWSLLALCEPWYQHMGQLAEGSQNALQLICNAWSVMALRCLVHLLHSDLTEATLAGATISLVAAMAIVILLTAVRTLLAKP